MGLLDNNIALVTGGAGGIGRAVAKRLLSEGAEAILMDMDRKKLDDAVEDISTGNKVPARFLCDITDLPAVESIVDDIIKDYGKVDILVNNAGITRDSFLHKMKREEWDKVIDVNLNGAFNCTRSVINHMRDAGYGRIINISSVVALSGNIGQANYISSKSALLGLTRATALENASRGITVNSIAPGFIETGMIGTIPSKIRDKILSRIPKGRFGDPEDIANAVCFLSSPEADYITGQTLSVNGGYYI